MAADDDKPLNTVFITISIMLATIMQALDTTIANVALPHMQGSLGATLDQVSWVLTSYIVAAAIMTPPTGFLADRLGRKRLFIICISGFTLTSILCGAAMSLPQMVFFRLSQGIFGAGLVPLSQAVLLDTFPKRKHGQAMALWGMGVMLGPILGPSLGGWLTEYYDWRWVFYINVPIGIVAIMGTLTFLPETPRNHGRTLDFFGFAMLSLSIGALQLMLDRGESKDWFTSPEIMIEATVGALCFYMFIVQMFTASHPFFDPKMFRDRNFTVGVIFIFIVGIILLSTMALMTPYLQTLRGYPVITTGIIMAPRGLGTMVAMMIVGRLIGKFDPRILILFGLSLTAWTLWESGLFTLDTPEADMIRIGVVQGFGMGFIFVPLSTIAYATLDPKYRNDGTAVFSLLRNIGSSIGISVMISLLARNTQINHAELAESLTPFSNGIRLLGAIEGRQGIPGSGTAAALSMLNGEVTRQAAMIGYLNDFRLMTYVVIAAIPLLLFLRPPDRRQHSDDETVNAAVID